MKFTTIILTATIGLVSFATAAPGGDDLSNSPNGTKIAKREYNAWVGTCTAKGKCKYSMAGDGMPCINSEVSTMSASMLPCSRVW